MDPVDSWRLPPFTDQQDVESLEDTLFALLGYELAPASSTTAISMNGLHGSVPSTSFQRAELLFQGDGAIPDPGASLRTEVPASVPHVPWTQPSHATVLGCLSPGVCVSAAPAAALQVPGHTARSDQTAPAFSIQPLHAVMLAVNAVPTSPAPAAPRDPRKPAHSYFIAPPEPTQPGHAIMAGCAAPTSPPHTAVLRVSVSVAHSNLIATPPLARLHTNSASCVAPSSAVPFSAAPVPRVTADKAPSVQQISAPSHARLGVCAGRPPIGRRSATEKRRRHRVRDGFKQLEKAIPALWLRRKCQSNLTFRTDIASLLHAAVDFIEELEDQKAQLSLAYSQHATTYQMT